MIKSVVFILAGIGAMSAATAQPQNRPSSPEAAAVPEAPPTMCRIWHRGVPADRQPPPTDCATARRQAAITGGEVTIGRTEFGGPLRVNDWPDRFRQEANARHELDRQRELRDRAIDQRIRDHLDRHWDEDEDW